MVPQGLRLIQVPRAPIQVQCHVTLQCDSMTRADQYKNREWQMITHVPREVPIEGSSGSYKVPEAHKVP